MGLVHVSVSDVRKYVVARVTGHRLMDVIGHVLCYFAFVGGNSAQRMD
jgi:hypothetical protein